eukprot:g74901.t1
MAAVSRSQVLRQSRAVVSKHSNMAAPVADAIYPVVGWGFSGVLVYWLVKYGYKSAYTKIPDQDKLYGGEDNWRGD